MRSSIGTKIRALILIPLGLLCCVAVLAFVVLTRHEIDDRTKSDAKAAAANMTAFLQEKTSHLTAETRLLALVPYIKGAVLTGDPATVQDELKQYSKLLQNDGLIILDSKGRILGKSGSLKNEAAGLAKAFNVDDALEGRSWSRIVAFDKDLVLASAAPLTDSTYNQGAVICYSVVNANVAQAISRQLSSEVVFVKDGLTLASSIELPNIRWSTSQLNFVKIDGGQYAGIYADLSSANIGAGTGVVTLRNVDEIIGPTKVLLITFLCVLVAALLITAYVSSRVAQNMTQPLAEVISAARTLEDGHWPAPLAITSKDEIGLLQSVFNQMTSSIQTQQERLKAMIDMDPLTELPNHRRFKEMLDDWISSAQANRSPLSLMILDIDNFGSFNKEKGLATGDKVLVSLANIVQGHCGSGFAARYGGEEFALVLPCGLAEANVIGDAVRRAFESSGFSLTLSGGCAQLSAASDSNESLCLAAELAVAQAKQLGRNQICDFDTISGEEGVSPFELNRFLQDGTLATIQALAAAVDAKDPYTQGHSERVAQYASDLCRHVGGSDSEVELIYRTGTLHDVGKIGVPDSILKKEGPLTAEERAIMETHSVLGELIVQKVPQLKEMLPGVRHHHERWDGKGYPDGLSGEGIPYMARVLALADTYDAMTSDRPYRRGLPVSVALGEISKNAGVQFDPGLAESFVAMMLAEAKAAA